VENVKEKIRSKEAPGATGANTEKKNYLKKNKFQVSTKFTIYGLFSLYFPINSELINNLKTFWRFVTTEYK